jgi:hypothetical protein
MENMPPNPKPYTVRLVVGKIYEVEVWESTPERATGIAVMHFHEGRIMGNARVVQSVEEVEQVTRVTL